MLAPKATDFERDWPLLYWLWKAISRGIAVLMLGFVGAWVVGITSGIATFYCYFIGCWLGIPLGFAIGTIFAFKIPRVDSLFVFGLGVFVWVVAAKTLVFPPQGHIEDFLLELFPTLLGAAFATFGFAARNQLPRNLKLGSGLVMNAVLAVMGGVGYYHHITQ